MVLLLTNMNDAGQKLETYPTTPDAEQKRAINARHIRELETKIVETGPAAIPYLIDGLDRADDHRARPFQNILVRFGPAIVQPLVQAIASKAQGQDHEILLLSGSVTIGKLGGEATKPLLAILTDTTNTQSRIAVMEVLQQLSSENGGDWSYVMPVELALAVCSALDDQNAMVRRAAAETLGYIGPRHRLVLDSLYRRLKNDPDAGVRRECAKALGNVGVRQCGEAVSETINNLAAALQTDEYYGTREFAALSFAKLRHVCAAEPVPVLMKGLHDPVHAVRRASISTLREFGPVAAPAVPELTSLLESSSPQDTVMLIGALSAIGEPAAPALPDALKAVERVTNADYGVANTFGELCKALGNKASPAVPILMRMLQTRHDDTSQTTIIQALGAIGPEARVAVNAIQKCADLNPHLKVFCDRAISEIQGTEAVPSKPPAAH